MRIVGLDLDDIIVEEYFKHRLPTKDYDFLMLEIKSALKSELGINDIEEAIRVYGKEECAVQVYKALNDYIDVTWNTLMYYNITKPPFQSLDCGIIIEKDIMDTYFGCNPGECTEEHFNKVQEMIDTIIKDEMKVKDLCDAIAKYGNAQARYYIEDRVKTILKQNKK